MRDGVALLPGRHRDLECCSGKVIKFYMQNLISGGVGRGAQPLPESLKIFFSLGITFWYILARYFSNSTPTLAPNKIIGAMPMTLGHGSHVGHLGSWTLGELAYIWHGRSEHWCALFQTKWHSTTVSFWQVSVQLVWKWSSLEFFLVLLLGKQSLLNSPAIFFDATLAVDGAEVDEVESVKEQDVFDLSIEQRVRLEARRVVHLEWR